MRPSGPAPVRLVCSEDADHVQSAEVPGLASIGWPLVQLNWCVVVLVMAAGSDTLIGRIPDVPFLVRGWSAVCCEGALYCDRWAGSVPW